MGRRGWPVSIALAVLAVPGTVHAADPVLELAPSSKWNAHYADDFCRLTRGFGEGRQEVVLVIDRFQPGDSFRLMFGGKPLGGGSPRGKARVQFGTALAEQELDYFQGILGKLPAWVFGQTSRIRPYPALAEDGQYISDGPVTAEEEASVTQIRIGRPLRRAIVLKTGPMKDAFAALDKCADELVTHWGIDVERHRTLSRWLRPLENPGTWIKSADYPRSMLNKWQPGLVQFRLIVGADGVPTGCHIQQSTNPEGFDEAVCKALQKRARFEPALDAEGKPLASYFISMVRFQII